MPTPKLNSEILNAAIEGFESQKRHIDSQIYELRQLLQGGPAEATATPLAPKARRKMSAAGRRRIAAAQKARWAKVKTEPGPVSAAHQAPKGKRRLSAAGRKAISDATKKRWALKRAEAALAAKKASK
jgi:hypothetical protein